MLQNHFYDTHYIESNPVWVQIHFTNTDTHLYIFFSDTGKQSIFLPDTDTATFCFTDTNTAPNYFSDTGIYTFFFFYLI